MCVCLERAGEAGATEEGEGAALAVCGSLHSLSTAGQGTEAMETVHGGDEGTEETSRAVPPALEVRL